MQMLNKNYINFLKKQNILILGATPRSGISIANVIYDINKSENININYALSDSKEREKLNLKDLKDKNDNVQSECDMHAFVRGKDYYGGRNNG